jgi:Domain of unknown function (DUF4124)
MNPSQARNKTMETTLAKIMIVAGLSLFLQTHIANAQIFQWTDAKGVIHFTDNPDSIPESIRNSSALIVRKDLDAHKNSSIGTSEPLSSPPNASPINPSDTAAATEPAQSVVTYAPQETNIVVSNSNSRRPHVRACKWGNSCRPAFRPNFNDRRYIHPSVFDGGSRQYIHP